MSLILDSRIHAHIDQVSQVVELRRGDDGMERSKHVERWAAQIQATHANAIRSLSD